MKKSMFFLLLLFLVPVLCIAQDVNQHVREIGLNLHSLSDFGLRFKYGNNKTLLRLTFNSLTGSTNQSSSNHSSSDSKTKSFGMGINLGIEKRNSISDKFVFYYGSDILTSYKNSSYETNGEGSNSNLTISSGIGLILGLEFKIISNLNISAEVMPSVSYNYGKNTDSGYVFNSSTTKGISYGLISPGASLTIAYRFGQKN